MTIDEALHRVVRGHWVLILVCVILPAVMTVGIGWAKPNLYEAEGRVQLGRELAASNVQADATSERALAIATSPGVVRRALKKVGMDDDAVAFAQDHVDVRRVGVSPIVEIAVTDTSPTRAAAIAASITDEVVQFANAGDRQPASDREDQLTKKLADLRKSRDALTPKLVTASPGSVLAIQARINAIQATISEYERQLSELDLASATLSRAVLLDPPTPPSRSVPSDVPQQAVLALLMGLLTGLGLAAAKETLWPTLHSPRAIAYAVGAPPIGHLIGRDTSSPTAMAAIGRIADRIALLGRRHGTEKIMLVPIREQDNVHAGLVASLLSPVGKGTEHRLECAVLESEWVEPGSDPAAVVFSPHRIRARELSQVQELLGSLGWPVIGVITYNPGRRSFIPDGATEPVFYKVISGGSRR